VIRLGGVRAHDDAAAKSSAKPAAAKPAGAAVTKHWAKQPPAQRKALLATYAQVRKALPSASEKFAWGMPTLDIGGNSVIHIEGFKNHNSIFPGNAALAKALAPYLKAHTITKGTIHFDREKAFPPATLRRIIRYRVEQINESYPKKSGEFKVFYDNGRLKAQGRYKNGRMHGAWQFFRKDGVKLRSGNFKDGKRTGKWITYDAKGRPYKTTEF
jgi:uncharacterized protein YdhG (YjbR/CyaY superfamily)